MRYSLRSVLSVAALSVASLSSLSVAHAQRIGSLQFLGQASFPARSQTLNGTTIGGLSGIAYDAARDQYYTNSDDPGNQNPFTGNQNPFTGDPRFYTVKLDLTGNTFGNSNVTFTGTTTLRNANGTPLAGGTVDLESLAYDATRDVIYVSDEGYANGNAATGNQPVSPSVHVFDRATGNQITQYAAPSKFAATGANGTTGIRNNLAFESATLTNGGTTLLTGTENALKQDGPAAAFGQSTNTRLLTFNTTTGTAGAEYLYVADPVTEQGAPGNFTVAGLVELLSLGGDDYLALERSFTVGGTAGGGTGYGIRLYQFSLVGATDISSFASLSAAGNVQAVQKTLLLDFSTLGVNLDNVEGMTLGPTLADGSRSLVLVSDDNFTTGQTTQFFAFRANAAAAPEPGTLALVGLGLLPLAGTVIRRRKYGYPPPQIATSRRIGKDCSLPRYVAMSDQGSRNC